MTLQLSDFAQPTFWTIPTWWLMLALTLRVLWRWRHSALCHALLWAVLALTWQGLLSVLELVYQVPVPARYFGLVLALCVPVAVLGARFRTATAWNFIVVGFLAVASLPIFEQPWASREWHLDGPRTLFLASVLGVGWVNYLPTRLAWTVSGLGWSVAWQLAALLLPDKRSGVLLLADWCTLAGMWWATLCASALLWRTSRVKTSANEPLSEVLASRLAVQRVMDQLWREIRDGWGLVWAWRMRELVRASAQHARLPGQFSWSGLTWPGSYLTSALPAHGATDSEKNEPDAAQSSPRDAYLDQWWHLIVAVARRFAPPSYPVALSLLKLVAANPRLEHQTDANQFG